MNRLNEQLLYDCFRVLSNVESGKQNCILFGLLFRDAGLECLRDSLAFFKKSVLCDLRPTGPWRNLYINGLLIWYGYLHLKII